MEKDIITLITEENSGFSKGKKLISKYITENYDKAAFMTAGKLGKTVGVSESTVVRFAAELGYDGYPGMRKALQEVIRSRLTSVQRIEAANELTDSLNFLPTVLRSDMERMQTTLNEINKNDFNEVVEIILNSANIYIVGMRSSFCLANFMWFYMNLIRENVRLMHDMSTCEIFEQIFRIREGDVCIGISYPRYSLQTVKAMEYAKKKGAAVIGITDAKTSPLSGISDISLFAKSDPVAFLDSLTAPLSLINALVAAVGVRGKDDLFDTFKQLETGWAENGVYEKKSG
ncbi:MAG: MurR/RpiR family transcriptional regulator [Oscillospiraceae bacterium]|nr:MurR/RpiR family transcriptional regulator [Oscillospiraceae bacterium]